MARRPMRWIAAAALAALASGASAETVLRETTLPLRLIGTVVAAQGERSIAVVESQGQTLVVRAGDSIGSARVEEIRKDGIVLAQAGQLERLALAPVAAVRPPGTELASASGTSGDDPDPDARHATDDEAQDASVRRARRAARARATRASAVPASAARSQDGEADAQVAEAVSNDQLLVNLSSQARYKPMLDAEGNLRGVAIIDVRPDSTLERLGLRSGDVVVSVAGVRVDNSPAALGALRGINPRAGGEVLVERGGVPTRITVPPGSL